MKNFTIPMALVDFIPVAMFAVAAIILQRDLYNKMSKGAFALFAAGTINIIFAGFGKALYKLLYAAKICDFLPLNEMFFPLQSIGFLLAGLGMFAMLFHRQTENAALSVAPVPFAGTMLFVILMVLGIALIDVALCVLSVRMKKPLLTIVFAVSFICMLCMGYLSSRDFSVASINWIVQGINTLAQGLFLYGVVKLGKSGLAQFAAGK